MILAMTLEQLLGARAHPCHCVGIDEYNDADALLVAVAISAPPL
jgi:hypothetical protein